MNIANPFDIHSMQQGPPLQLGYIQSQDRGAGDIVLTDVAFKLMAAGYTVCGAVQCNTERSDGDRCDMDIILLPGGQKTRVSQALGPGATGCRLDNGALEQAVADVETRITPRADLLVINKFGKQEALGGGFRGLIATALSWGIPVLTSVNALNQDAFLEFSAGFEIEVQADASQIVDWFHVASRARNGQLART